MKKILIFITLFTAVFTAKAQLLPNTQVWGNTKLWGITTNNDTSGYLILDQIRTFLAAGSGTVTSVGKTAANGFDLTISNPTTTPNISVSTTVTGMIKGNGTAISAATAGTDFLQTLSGDVTTSGQVATIANNAVTTAKIVDANVTGAKLATGAVDLASTKVTGILPIASGGTGSATQNFVDLSTNQSSIAGNKTFTGATTLSGGLSSSGGTTLGGNLISTPTVLSSATTLSGTSNNIIYLNASTAFTVTLPTTPTNGTTYRFIKTNTTTTVPTLARGGSDTIMGATSHVIYSANRIVTLTYNSGVWYQD